MSSTNSGIQALSGLFSNGAPGSSGVSNTIMPASGSNQYSMYPSTSGSSYGVASSGPVGTPGVVPNYGSIPSNSPAQSTSANTGAYYASGGNVPGTNSIHMTPTMDPTLTQQYYAMLSNSVGQGLPAFDLSTLLPSSGQATQSGQLNAPLNNVYQQLEGLLTGGPSTLPGAAQATQMAQTGSPVNQTPAWQAMLGSEQQNTAQNANNLREQYAGLGALDSSSFGNAMQQFYNQNAENQNAQLTAATTAEGDQAANRALSAQQGLQSLAGSTGQNLQTIDQSAIQNMLQEYNYTLPQNNPLLANIGQAALDQPGTGQTPTTAQNIEGILKGIGSIF